MSRRKPPRAAVDTENYEKRQVPNQYDRQHSYSLLKKDIRNLVQIKTEPISAQPRYGDSESIVDQHRPAAKQVTPTCQKFLKNSLCQFLYQLGVLAIADAQIANNTSTLPAATTHHKPQLGVFTMRLAKIAINKPMNPVKSATRGWLQPARISLW